mmetsp:Transcript_28686/g.34939  ORF Transcript_28686/g.34939 Transcript_28686/m.34939 type:complete len:256 (+) Transcript_28686:75-842(+)|eukprot:CAMPEP_0172513632 /NCGR_PEP_ID=MMETSP1066-20121228/254022_1 /TAXON_ID=671091 /ORGANISM="Coscinodiscus wailesii, Strain CCMP2513" /LENGTH=255 /DNA_ID=CAMNT_0013293979 /DNA_START=75 /DNA_END=842 /DNA_ORIENTATION=+
MTQMSRPQRVRRLAQTTTLDDVDENSVLQWQNNSTKEPLKRDALDDFDGTNPEHVESLLHDLTTEMERRKKLALHEIDSAGQAIQETFAVSMIGMPTSVRKMTIKEFNEMYGCNILKEMEDDAKNEESSASVDKVNRINARIDSNPYETPARGSTAHVPQSALRTVKKGEKIYSRNGTPIDKSNYGDLVATVMKKRRNGSDSGIQLEVNIGDGETLDLMRGDASKKITDATKSSVISQFKDLQGRVAAVLKELEG